jgi:hypothetical protein
MKYHSIITSALTSFCLLTSNSSLATESAKSSADQARWFEIEVIIFKHLSSSTAKNSENTEQFSPPDLSTKNRQAFDLLAPYLQPDIASLKKLLPNCEQPEAKLPYNITPSTLWADKLDNESNDADSNNSNSSDSDTVSSQVVDNKESNSSTTMSVTVLSSAPNEKVKDDVATAVQQGLKKEGLSEVSKQVHSGIIEPAIELPIYNQYPISSNTPLCVVPAEFFQQYLTAEQLEQFKIDGFPVEKTAKTIDGLEQWQDDENGEITWASDSPYLISQNSLRLKSIANSLKRSRSYAPLLHLGWRQIGDSRRQAKAMKLYAGDNLELGYQQAIAVKALEQKTLEIQAILEKRQQNSALSSQIRSVDNETVSQSDTATNSTSNNSGMIISQSDTSDLAVENAEATSELSITEQLRLQAKQQQLDNIFEQFTLLGNQTDTNTSNSESNADNETLSEVSLQAIIDQLSSDITVKKVQLSVKNSTDPQVAITAPLQPWSLDGLFKVHLKRNNYLYIESELNIVDSTHKPSVLNATQKLTNKVNKTLDENKVISFKQDRRVITGEIHYFDHPRIGMIVQLRRFDPTKPADEAVSQAKK